jgi:hypothetical protein
MASKKENEYSQKMIKEAGKSYEPESACFTPKTEKCSEILLSRYGKLTLQTTWYGVMQDKHACSRPEDRRALIAESRKHAVLALTRAKRREGSRQARKTSRQHSQSRAMRAAIHLRKREVRACTMISCSPAMNEHAHPADHYRYEM